MSDGIKRPDGNGDYFAWRIYWTKKGEPWRTEPEIDEARQAFLLAQAETGSSLRQPFQGVSLERADIEWLIAYGVEKHGRIGRKVNFEQEYALDDGLDDVSAVLNLSGADLRGKNLSYLPLTGIIAGGDGQYWDVTSERSHPELVTHFEGASLFGVHLEGASLAGANMAGADLREARLEGAALMDANLRGARIAGAHLDVADLTRVDLEDTNFFEVREKPDTDDEDPMAIVDPYERIAAWLQGTVLTGANLRNANLREAHLEGANLIEAQLEGCDLTSAHFEGTANPDNDRRKTAQLPKVWWHEALAPAQLQRASFDFRTRLDNVHLGDDKCGYVSIADVFWGGANLAVVPWQHVTMLGDERTALTKKMRYGMTKREGQKRDDEDYDVAVRANRQLAIALASQGIKQEADRFAYRAQRLQRRVLLRQGQRGRAVGSWLLDLISGYGYKPIRSVWTYLLVVVLFATAYFALTNFTILPFLASNSSPLSWYEALVLSVSSFHGRGLFPTGLTLGDPISIVAACEAIIGLFIEITFIATFTQRFFSR